MFLRDPVFYIFNHCINLRNCDVQINIRKQGIEEVCPESWSFLVYQPVAINQKPKVILTEAPRMVQKSSWHLKSTYSIILPFYHNLKRA